MSAVPYTSGFLFRYSLHSYSATPFFSGGGPHILFNQTFKSFWVGNISFVMQTHEPDFSTQIKDAPLLVLIFGCVVPLVAKPYYFYFLALIH